MIDRAGERNRFGDSNRPGSANGGCLRGVGTAATVEREFMTDTDAVSASEFGTPQSGRGRDGALLLVNATDFVATLLGEVGKPFGPRSVWRARLRLSASPTTWTKLCSRWTGSKRRSSPRREAAVLSPRSCAELNPAPVALLCRAAVRGRIKLSFDSRPHIFLPPTLTAFADLLMSEEGAASDDLTVWKGFERIAALMERRTDRPYSRHAVSNLLWRLGKGFERAGVDKGLIESEAGLGARLRVKRTAQFLPPAG